MGQLLDKYDKKVVLVTGASSSLGKAFAFSLLNEGMTVYAAAREPENIEDLVEAGAHSLRLDITNHDNIESAVKRIIDTDGKIDVLINNAGYSLYGPVEHVSVDEARQHFDVNIFGLAKLTQTIIPHMRLRRSGRIINISSMGGKVYSPFGAWHHAAKHALEGWSDCLRIELKRFGIHVVVMEPGEIETEFGGAMTNGLLERVRGTAYEGSVKRLLAATAGHQQSGIKSTSDSINELFIKALNATRPRARYVAGNFAEQMMFIRKWLGDRVFDRLLLSMMK